MAAASTFSVNCRISSDRLLTTVPSLQWQLLSEEGPHLTRHAACILNGKLYVHGGHASMAPDAPVQSQLYSFDLTTRVWQMLACDNAPALSAHVLMACAPNHLIIVGGWTGKRRTFEVLSLELNGSGGRYCWHLEQIAGFAEGAGLSGHTAVPLIKPHNSYLIFGREGSLRTQRRNGSAWLLRGAPLSGYVYEKLPIMCASRSGHCAASIGSELFLVLGGRDDHLVEEHSLAKCRAQLCHSTVVNELLAVTFKAKNSRSVTAGVRNAVVLSGLGGALLYGGFSFSAGPSSQEALNEFLLICNSKVAQIVSTASNVDANSKLCNGRACSTACVDPVTGKAYLFGGCTGHDERVCNQLYQLILQN